MYVPSTYEAWPVIAASDNPPTVTNVEAVGVGQLRVTGRDLDMLPGGMIQWIGTYVYGGISYPTTEYLPATRSSTYTDWSRTNLEFFQVRLIDATVTSLRLGDRPDSPEYVLPTPLHVPGWGDTTPPAISINLPQTSVAVGQSAGVSWTCTDASTVTACDGRIVEVPGGLTPNGGAWWLYTNAPGTYTVEVTARDSSNNTATKTATYTVVASDSDQDGIDDAIDTGSGAAFADNGNPPTTGAITDTAGLPVSITDALAPDGVTVRVGPGPAGARATLTVCGFTVRLYPDSSAVFTCGSLIVKTTAGVVEVVSSDGTRTTAVPSGAAAKFTAGAGGADTVVQTAGAPLQRVSALQFPVITRPGVFNTTRTGSIVPLSWKVSTITGTPVNGLTSATVRTSRVQCPRGPAVPATTAAWDISSRMLPLGRGLYAAQWRPPTSLTGTCQLLWVDMGGGLTTPVAGFRFVR